MGFTLPDNIEIHMIELQKLRENAVGQERKLLRWTLFLLGSVREKLEDLAMEEPITKKALTTLEFWRQDRKARERDEARQKGIRDWNSSIQGAREKGIEEGLKEGYEEVLKEIARRMLTNGIPLGKIAELTELTMDTIEQLNSDLNLKS